MNEPYFKSLDNNLVEASRNGELEIVKKLMCNYNDRTLFDSIGSTFLGNFNDADFYFHDALIEASKEGHVGVIKELLASSLANGFALSHALATAIINGQTEIVKVLINDSKVSLDKLYICSTSPLELARKYQRTEIAVLIQKEKFLRNPRESKEVFFSSESSSFFVTHEEYKEAYSVNKAARENSNEFFNNDDKESNVEHYIYGSKGL